ncbi:acylneuraminate cytidylyltransferase family protein [Noviherbaspirillum sp. CPCC 100848]|uniref:Acylneuraminate cytidylyltransferase family protein n=1 Tax=Noviherbaspirillum album TaxID=3080276 RepID=A0ABU6JCG3_9BURK|nr:acylneuraminate cytidylyltransferase family protein [Noviherbaspirillum sp. CPCC 100848]MEC4721343.1 acylneuraminate cytidylyltransferase family protein [Noviherbaspirillum sp. CPCC 100848]
MSVNNRPVIGLIPARGGSKGVRRKNMYLVNGVPLVDFTIHAALAAKSIDLTYLSSDDPEILAYGEKRGVLRLARPEEFASDTASATCVVSHLLESLPNNLANQDPYIVYLQPTSPLRTGTHIDTAFMQMTAQDAHSVISVVEMTKSPFKCFSIDSNGKLRSLFEEKMSNMRRQDLPKAFIPNGAIYIFRASEFVSRAGFPSNGSVAFAMTQLDSIDVDSENDFRYLEYIMKDKNG